MLSRVFGVPDIQHNYNEYNVITFYLKSNDNKKN